MGKVKKKETEAAPGIGHNSGVSGARIRAFVERVERLEEEKHALSLDIKDVYGEAKATGFDTKIIRKCVSRRKMAVEVRQEQDELLSLYEAALLS